jgi:putative Mn2+ efflux pump MntP
MAIAMFCQNMGAAVSLIAANAIFSNSLRRQLQDHVADIGIAPEVIINAGIRSVRQLFERDSQPLAIVLQAYSDSVDKVMYLGIAVSIAAFAFGWGLGFRDIRVERKMIALRAVSLQEEREDGKPTAAGQTT